MAIISYIAIYTISNLTKGGTLLYGKVKVIH